MCYYKKFHIRQYVTTWYENAKVIFLLDYCIVDCVVDKSYNQVFTHKIIHKILSSVDASGVPHPETY